MKKKLFISFIYFSLFKAHLLSYSSNPKDFVNELVNDAITKLSDKNLNKEEKAKFY